MFAHRRHAPDLPDPPRRRHRRARPRRQHWAEISTRPNRDAPVGDPAMGGHASFALGLALARPNDKIVLFDSEGDLLMSLGILPTIAEQTPANFYHFMLDNECYATTGGQPVPNAKNVAYDVIARGCGYPRAFAFDHLEEFAGEHRRRSWASRGRCSWRSRCCRRSRTCRSASGRAGRRARGSASWKICVRSRHSPPDTRGIRSAEAELEDARGHQRLPGDREAEHRHDGR